MRRIASLVLCTAACLAAVPAVALAQQSPFGPLPAPAQPTATPTPDSTNVLGQDVGRKTLYAIAGGFVLLFIGIGWWISRDARRERHRRQREKERARKKTRAQRQARKAHRKR
jgi:transposase